ncbi:MAG: hypothetical protein ACTHJ5_04700 [Ilyomonas sp.]
MNNDRSVIYDVKLHPLSISLQQTSLHNNDAQPVNTLAQMLADVMFQSLCCIISNQFLKN